MSKLFMYCLLVITTYALVIYPLKNGNNVTDFSEKSDSDTNEKSDTESSTGAEENAKYYIGREYSQ